MGGLSTMGCSLTGYGITICHERRSHHCDRASSDKALSQINRWLLWPCLQWSRSGERRGVDLIELPYKYILLICSPFEWTSHPWSFLCCHIKYVNLICASISWLVGVAKRIVHRSLNIRFIPLHCNSDGLEVFGQKFAPALTSLEKYFFEPNTYLSANEKNFLENDAPTLRTLLLTNCPSTWSCFLIPWEALSMMNFHHTAVSHSVGFVTHSCLSL